MFNFKLKMKSFFLTVFSFIAIQALVAQVTFPEFDMVEPTGPEIFQRIEISQDTILLKMLDWHIQQNKMKNGIDGFRVEIFFSSDNSAKQEAFKKKVEFLSLYPDYPVHIKYDAPNFRLRVGDFRTKNEALKLYTEIRKDYPVAFIVADIINFPLLKQNKL